MVEAAQLVFVVLALDGLALNFQLADAALQLIQLFGHGVHLQLQLGGAFVDQVNGLVGQEAVGDVAVGKLYRGNDGGVLDAHAVMAFVAVFQPAQDGNGVFHRWLVTIHFLKAALKGLVFLKVLLVLVQRGCANRAELAAGKGGLQDIGGIHRAIATAARADERVDFIDEEDDFAVAFGHFFYHAFEALFKLAFVLRAGNELAHVEGVDDFGFQVIRHVAIDDAVCEAFNNGRLTYAGLAYENRVILRAAGKNVQRAADFLVAANDRVKLVVLRQLVEVFGVAVQRLVLLVGGLAVDGAAFAQLFNGGNKGFFG